MVEKYSTFVDSKDAGIQNDSGADRARPVLVVRTITPVDLLEALGDGLRDFRRAPIYGLGFGLFYALFGGLLIAIIFASDLDYYAFPMATGFALVAPFVAAGCYEVSRRLEGNLPLNWGQVLKAVRTAGGKDLNWMAVVTVFTYIIWLDIAFALYAIFFGLKPLGFSELLAAVVTSWRGAAFFVIGSTVGAVLALVVFSITAISFPILFERKVDFVTAMITSVRAVGTNPTPMLIWCALIGGGLAISILSGFLALIVVLPVLGHATWHLYRRLIARPDPDTV